MKCVDARTIDCKPKPRNKLLAHISTFEDGSTSVLCHGKDEVNSETCSLTGKKCAFVRESVEQALQNVSPIEAAKMARARIERELIEKTLAETKGIKAAAKQLKISEIGLKMKMAELKIANPSGGKL